MLEEELAAAKPDMSSIEAFAKKAEEYEERAAELARRPKSVITRVKPTIS